MRDIFRVLQTNLQEYSQEYSKEIRVNKEIRGQFNQICNKLGIDPIVSKIHYKKAKDQFGEFLEIFTIKFQFKSYEFVKSKKNSMED